MLQLIVDLEVVPKERRACVQLDGCTAPSALKLPYSTRSNLARVALSKLEALTTAAVEVREPGGAKLLDLHNGSGLHSSDACTARGELADAPS